MCARASQIHASIAKRCRSGEHKLPAFPELKDDQLGVVWIGHASFLLQIGGQNLLIDPNWAKWLKVIKRIRHPGLQIHDLPNIDLVLVTHTQILIIELKNWRGKTLSAAKGRWFVDGRDMGPSPTETVVGNGLVPVC